MTDNDLQLVKEMKAGKPEAFEEMVLSYQKRVYCLAYNLTHNQSDAEDISQEVFLRVCNKINTFLGKAAFSSWVYRITLNVSFMKLKSRKKIQQIPFNNIYPKYQEDGFHAGNINDWSMKTDDVLLNSESRKIIQKAINQLPEKEKKVFVLRDIEGLPTEKVCDILELSVPAVKSRLHRSRLFLRKRLSNYFDDFK
tara:strand:- start:13401 stop:13988 length:588 start_codon:yes stop_codon:yes gene_type:complete